MPCYSLLKGWRDPETNGIVFRRDGKRLQEMEVACGQCLGCRLDRSRMWAMRIVHECSLHESRGGNCFVTLTYRSKEECDQEQLEKGYHVPDDWSLHKDHLQKFWKRLRKSYGRKIRYFAVGEYGNGCKHGINLELVGCPLCNVGRPHYHAIVFGLQPDDLEAYSVGFDGESKRFTSPRIEKIWRYGFVDVGAANFETAAYVARYCLKKVNGVRAPDHYMQTDVDGVCTWVEPEFSAMSRRPGIGKEWYEKYKGDIFPSDEVPVPGSGVYKKVPRYYEELFKESDPLTLEEIKEKRKQFKEDNAGEYTPERLMAKYKVKKAQTAQLKRSL